jgi:hypothetical protein
MLPCRASQKCRILSKNSNSRRSLTFRGAVVNGALANSMIYEEELWLDVATANSEGASIEYGVDWLAWFATYQSIETAIRREKQIKQWQRNWKINLIERDNPHWMDLYSNLSL